MSRIKLMKERWFPLPHDMKVGWTQSMEIASQYATIVPLVAHDEATAASTVKTNPENASFAETSSPLCFPESHIDSIQAQLTVSITKGAFETDKVHAIKFATMPIYTAFKEPLLAIDELSGLETQDILELQSEATDRQTYPLYNGTDLGERNTGSSALHADVQGLTTDQKLEGVDFQSSVYYDALQYHTTGAKLRTMQGGLKWHMVNKTHPVKKLNIRLPPNTKYINEYAFFGLLVYVPSSAGREQIHPAGDTTAIPHLSFSLINRFNEWNSNFDFNKI